MKKNLFAISLMMILFSTYSYADPMGLSEYIQLEHHGSTVVERRMTNYEAARMQKAGVIKADGQIDPVSNNMIVRRPLPSSSTIASQTNTKHLSHPQSKGTIHVRPTNMPSNPSQGDIIRMQQHIQHIERTVGKALDLSRSAYAVAELPQATEGRSGISVGMAENDGKAAEAVGYSSNFGDKHEYTVKISLSHSGHEDAMGAGFGWQW